MILFFEQLSKSGPTKVTLKNVTKEQSGIFECEVSSDAPLFETGLGFSQMRVISEYVHIGDVTIPYYLHGFMLLLIYTSPNISLSID